jgi:hypothetical protein
MTAFASHKLSAFPGGAWTVNRSWARVAGLVFDHGLVLHPATAPVVFKRSFVRLVKPRVLKFSSAFSKPLVRFSSNPGKERLTTRRVALRACVDRLR